MLGLLPTCRVTLADKCMYEWHWRSIGGRGNCDYDPASPSLRGKGPLVQQVT
jgi:hypothetical protein